MRQFDIDDTSKWQEKFGNGSDGDLVINDDTTASFDYKSACTGTEDDNELVATHASFAPGQIILIHQSMGAGAGNWELNVIEDYEAGLITTKYDLQNTYVTGAQVIRLPQFRSVTIASGKTLTAEAWNDATGGILAFLCSGQVTITGNLNMNSKGFKGGYRRDVSGNNGQGTTGFTMYGADRGNAGQGGTKAESGSTGGAGGGNGSAGANAFPKQIATPLGGAVAGNSDLSLMVFGGGGGMGGDGWQGGNNGAGGIGGGIILVIGKRITVTGSIVTNATAGAAYDPGHQKAAAGGGGAGGSINVKGQTIVLGTNLLTCAGGAGGEGKSDSLTQWGGPGGAGGSGRINANYSVSLSGSATPAINSSQDLSLVDASGGFLGLM